MPLPGTRLQGSAADDYSAKLYNHGMTSRPGASGPRTRAATAARGCAATRGGVPAR